MRVTVVGGNSFSGVSVIKKLLLEGHEVMSLGRSRMISGPFNQFQDLTDSRNFRFRRGNLNKDTSKMANKIRSFKPEIILNFAAQSMVSESWQSPEDWYDTNISSFSKLIHQIKTLESLEKFIQFSTPEVYGSTNSWIKENFDFSPSTPYAISRAASDFHLKCMFDSHSFPVIFTRTANIYGPGQQIYRIIPRAILAALKKEKISLHGGGKSERSFIYSEDVSDAVIKVLNQGIIGGSYHISTNEIISIYNLIKLISEKLEIDMEEFTNISEERPGKDQAYKLDSTFLRESFGWEEKVNLEMGIDHTIKWVKDNYNVLKNLPTEYKHKR
jgi:dTDP-glucose 4,6-dehydratase